MMPGPAKSAAARPVSTKMPVPMMQRAERNQVECVSCAGSLLVFRLHLRDRLAHENLAQDGNGCLGRDSDGGMQGRDCWDRFTRCNFEQRFKLRSLRLVRLPGAVDSSISCAGPVPLYRPMPWRGSPQARVCNRPEAPVELPHIAG